MVEGEMNQETFLDKIEETEIKEVNESRIKFSEVNDKKKDVSNQDDDTESASIDYNVLFISFDIVNSSQYKEKNKDNWLKTITTIFSVLKESVFSKMPSAELWRVIGDEIIFIVKIADISILAEHIEKAFLIIQEIDEKIEKNELSNVEEIYTKNSDIGLQGAAWLAMVSDETKDDKNSATRGCENVFIVYKNQESGNIRRVYEFMGNDIDTGFRIKKFTKKGRLVIGFELAIILSEITLISYCLHIIAFKRLKGVWNNKLYPIIWYHNISNCKFEDSFRFDDAAEDELIQEYFENKNGKNEFVNVEMFTNTYTALHKIAEERQLEGKIEKMRVLMNDKNELPKILLEPQEEIKLQLTAACYDDDTHRILIFKRRDHVHNGSKWEIGHVLAQKSVDNQKCIKEGYLKKYGLNIKVMLDCKKSDRQPVPLYLYQYVDPVDSDIYHRGITVPAIVLEKGKVKYPDNEYEDFRWIAEEEIDSLNEEDCVDDLKRSLKAAFGWFRNNGNDFKRRK